MTEEEYDDIPDVLLMTLDKAELLLRSAGIPFITEETEAVRREPVEGIFRVIRQQNRNGEAVLTICRIPDIFQN